MQNVNSMKRLYSSNVNTTGLLFKLEALYTNSIKLVLSIMTKIATSGYFQLILSDLQVAVRLFSPPESC